VFVATKVDEMPRKLKEIVIACCRVAQKNPVLLVDEHTKDFWRWKDTIVLYEDLLLEFLCFDLTLECPYKLFYEMIQKHAVSHNKDLRNAGWAFINDSGNTQLCLLYPARTIACAALYCAAKLTNASFADDARGRPWWEQHDVQGLELRRAYNHMMQFFEEGSLKPSSDVNIYVGGRTPLDGDERFAKTRLRHEQAPSTPNDRLVVGSESPRKRPRDDAAVNGNGAGVSRVPPGAIPPASKRAKTDEERNTNGNAARQTSEQPGSEDGEVED